MLARVPACNTDENTGSGDSALSELEEAKRIIALTRKLKSARKEVWQASKELDNTKDAINKLFGDDQLKVLVTGTIKGSSWKNKTVQVALKLRLLCGLKGYNALLAKGFPFPSDRTLRHKIEQVKFPPGILPSLKAKAKVQSMSPKEQQAVLMLDEMAIQH